MVQNLYEQPELRKVLVREGCYLRPLEVEDAEEILRILDDDPAIRDRVTVASRMHTIDDVAREVKTYKTDNEGLIRYAIIFDDHCVGLVSLWRDSGFFGQPLDPDAYGFGYFIDPAMRGKGVVTAAVESLMKQAERLLRVKQFIAYCEDDNLASIAILHKLGFQATDETFSEPNQGWTERKYVKTVEA